MRLPCGTHFDNYRADHAWWRTKFVWVRMLLGFFFLFIVIPYGIPHVIPGVGDYWLSAFNLVGYTVLAALGVQLLIGYTGQITLGHAAPIGFGAFACALSMYLLGVPYIVGIIIAIISAGLLSLLFGLPCVKVKGFYVIMTTMAMQFIVIDIVLTQFLGPLAGRGRGGVLMVEPEMFSLGPWIIYSVKDAYIWMLILVIILQVFMANLMRSKVGRAWAAIRDNDIAAEALGVDIVKYKLLAFFIAGGMGGLAGAYWLTNLSIVSPEHFTFGWSLWLVGVLLIGGCGTMYGAIYGAMFMTLVLELIKLAIVPLAPIWPALSQKFLYLKDIFFGLAIILFLIFEPNGLSYRWWRIKRYIWLWPFPYD